MIFASFMLNKYNLQGESDYNQKLLVDTGN